MENAFVLIALYLLIGFGNYASHVISCMGCRMKYTAIINELIDIKLHMIWETCLWPQALYRYYLAFTNQTVGHMPVIKLERTKEESEEDYRKRVNIVIDEIEKRKVKHARSDVGF